MSEAYGKAPAEGAGRSQRSRGRSDRGAPAEQRELRAQGRRTMQRLRNAAIKTFAERGYQAARVDDIVRAARTSHGTFYLYFANKEDLLRTLATECAQELTALAGDLGDVTADAAGYDALRAFLDRFLRTYEHYGPVIRAWMEGQVDDRHVNRMGLDAFTSIARSLAARMHAAGCDASVTTVGALMAMLERFAYYFVSRGVDVRNPVTLDALATVVHRGFFGAPARLAA
jgi:AcrR family transcriptional regulator